MHWSGRSRRIVPEPEVLHFPRGVRRRGGDLTAQVETPNIWLWDGVSIAAHLTSRPGGCFYQVSRAVHVGPKTKQAGKSGGEGSLQNSEVA